MTSPRRLYRCPACGDVITEEEYLDWLSVGVGYCMCQYTGDGERILTGYEVYTKEEKA